MNCPEKIYEEKNPKEFRKNILDFAEVVKAHPNSLLGDNDYCPLKHSFSDGIYVREIFIPAHTYVVGKIHKHSHPNFLMSGEVNVVTHEGSFTIKAPCSMISTQGTQRALYTLTDTTWITVHLNPSNTQDLQVLEEQIIAKSYDEYDKFLNKKNTILSKLKHKLIKGLL